MTSAKDVSPSSAILTQDFKTQTVSHLPQSGVAPPYLITPNLGSYFPGIGATVLTFHVLVRETGHMFVGHKRQ